MFRVTKDELAFLRWLRTNGGHGTLLANRLAVADRLIKSGHVEEHADSVSVGTAHYILTDVGYETLGLYERNPPAGR
jgi:hypothetical protein